MSFAFAADDYNTWTNSQTLYLNTNASTGANIIGDVRNFPVLVRLTSATWPTGAKTDGTDIRFSKADGTHLYYEQERWANSSQLAEFWVLVDSVYGYNNAHSDSTTIKMYWGNSGAGDSSNAAKTFDTTNGFIIVYHMNERPVGAGDIKDRTINANNGTSTNMESTDTIAGNIGLALAFDGSNEYITLASNATMTNVKNKMSISIWAYNRATNNRCPLAAKYNNSTDAGAFFMFGNPFDGGGR